MPPHPPPAPLVVLMGVSGSGKTTLGRLLAQRSGGIFYDADDFHPAGNIAKMRRGEPLDDADRTCWLETLATLLRSHPCEGPPLFLACSALKEAYRQTLRAAAPGRVRFFFLDAPPELIHQRLLERQNRGEHFMPPALLASQFATLETPNDAVRLDVSSPPALLATTILAQLGIPD
jgi:gluconokinase